MGTNDLNFDKSSELIVKSIADVGPSLKNESRDASISSITVRDDNFKEKDAEVNDYLMINDYSARKEYPTLSLEQKQMITEQER